MLLESGVIFLEGLKLLGLEEHAPGRRHPVAGQRLENWQTPLAPVHGEQPDGGQHPQRSHDPGVLVSEQNHHQEEEDAEEPDHAKHRKPDLVALIGDADVERHLVGAGRERTSEPEHEQRDEDQQVAGSGAEGIEIGQDVDGGGPARWP